MKRITIAIITAAVLSGCTSTKTIITEFDKDGKITKKTETTESVVTTVTSSTKDKTVVLWQSGWAAYMSASTATTENPTPTLKMFAGKTDKGMVSAHKEMTEYKTWKGIAAAINATKYDLTVTSDGITSGSSETTTAKTSAKKTEAKTETTTKTETAATVTETKTEAPAATETAKTETKSETTETETK